MIKALALLFCLVEFNLIGNFNAVAEPSRVIIVAGNCPPGHGVGKDGKCVPVWNFSPPNEPEVGNSNAAAISENTPEIEPFRVIVVPGKCPPGQGVALDGKCVPIWGFADSLPNESENVDNTNAAAKVTPEIVPSRVIIVPGKCPPGHGVALDGKCVPVWNFSAPNGYLYKSEDVHNAAAISENTPEIEPFRVIIVPGKCPPGHGVGLDGKCVPVWGFANGLPSNEPLVDHLKSEDVDNTNAAAKVTPEIVPSRVIIVPGKCPPGHGVGLDGKCVPVWNYTAPNKHEVRNSNAGAISENTPEIEPFRVIVVPGKCPPGHGVGLDGKCVPVWG